MKNKYTLVNLKDKTQVRVLINIEETTLREEEVVKINGEEWKVSKIS